MLPGESSAPGLPYVLSYAKTEDLHMCVLLQVMNLCMYFNLKCSWNWKILPCFVLLRSLCRNSWVILPAKVCFCSFAIGFS